MRHAKRVDANHAAITLALRQAGWRVTDLSHVGHGCPDLVAEKPQRVVWIEVKDGSKPPSKRVLTDKEALWHALLIRADMDVRVIERVEQVAEI